MIAAALVLSLVAAEPVPRGQVVKPDPNAGAQPLKIRVLEKERAVEAEVVGAEIYCDTKKLANASIEIRAADRRLHAGDQVCEQVTVNGPELTVTLKEDLNGPHPLTRVYPSKLVFSNETELLKIVNVVDPEDYLPSVLESEVKGFPAASLEAQAIVSRTYAAASRGRHGQNGYDLCDLAHCQLYRGRSKDADAKAAVAKTKGQVLLVGGVVLKPAFFHSSCGGATSKAVDVFGDEGAGMAIVDTGKDGPMCKNAPDFAWTWEVERTELANRLNLRNDGAAVEVLRRDQSGRILQLKSFGSRFSGVEFLSKVGLVFGFDTLRSMKVTVEEVEGVVRFKGTGLGHGAGMCQEGAKAIATAGGTSKQILQRYFPDCQVRVLN